MLHPYLNPYHKDGMLKFTIQQDMRGKFWRSLPREIGTPWWFIQVQRDAHHVNVGWIEVEWAWHIEQITATVFTPYVDDDGYMLRRTDDYLWMVIYKGTAVDAHVPRLYNFARKQIGLNPLNWKVRNVHPRDREKAKSMRAMARAATSAQAARSGVHAGDAGMD